MRNPIKKVLGSTKLRNFMLGSYAAARFFSWGQSNYLKTFSTLDERYFRWLYLLEETKDLDGDIVELGVGPGRFLAYCASWMKAKGINKRYYGYDTFGGFPSVDEKDKENLSPERLKRVQPGNYAFSKARIERMAKRLSLQNITLVEGDFSKTLKETKPAKISFLYIDCDLYEGYKAGLETLYDRVAKGGAILFDEYERTHEWPGAKRAVDEFFLNKEEKPQKLPFSTSFYVIRGQAAGSREISRY